VCDNAYRKGGLKIS